MLLAATKATFKSEFGQSFIRAEYQAANANELKLENFEQRLNGPRVPDASDDNQPMSYVERELHNVHKDRVALPFANHSTQTLRGVQFPVDQDAIKRIKEFAQGQCDFVQLSVDTLNEAIKLEAHLDELAVDHLSGQIPKQKPRYSLYRFKGIDDSPVCKSFTEKVGEYPMGRF